VQQAGHDAVLDPPMATGPPAWLQAPSITETAPSMRSTASDALFLASLVTDVRVDALARCTPCWRRPYGRPTRLHACGAQS